jgi:hypothetical protein
MKQVLLVVAAIVAAIVLSQLLFQFYAWNQLQTCATSGGRNCAGPRTRIER